MSLQWQGDVSLIRPGTSPAPDLKIIKAEYGASDKWLDVTEIAAKAVHDGRLILHVGNNLGPDPIHGTVKSLRLTYASDGREQTARAVENEDLLIDPAPDRRRLVLRAGHTDKLSFVCAFAPKPLPNRVPDTEATFAACRRQWPAYWQSGGAVDLSESKDPRWHELERRIVLSQYLMKVNEAGSLPPQESGLVNNGWFGRFHMEMVWWHAAHWALWNRWPELDRSMTIYNKLLPNSEKLAKSEGYLGARWPKCIGPNLREWPHTIHALLIWQQPHPIFFAELDYRAHLTKATLEKWRPWLRRLRAISWRHTRFTRQKRSAMCWDYAGVRRLQKTRDPKTTENPAYLSSATGALACEPPSYGAIRLQA